MAPNADPWRTLGLSPGATQDEIRRAYRRLAKVNHPDAAGESALPRFLAIQAAYEQLAGPARTRRVGARPPGRPSEGAASAEARPPWQADPNRARASGRADGRRSPGARPTGPGARPRPPAGGAKPGAQPGAAAGAPPGPGGAGPADDPAAGSHRSHRSSRRRPANTATPGSTSYEGADQEPFEPGWSGATWYGASSGTYWTINPKEYADPRKHGPEYQARARRSREGWVLEDGAAAEPGEPPPPGADDVSSAERPADVPASQPGAARPAPEAGPPFVAGQSRRARGDRRHRPDGRPAMATTGAPAAEARSPDVEDAAGARPGDARPGDARPGNVRPGNVRPGNVRPGNVRPGNVRPADRSPSDDGAGGLPPGGLRAWIEQPADDHGGFRGPLLRRPATPSGRVAMALLGWPPLGLFAAAAIDQSTGCGGFAASCPEISSPGTWILQAAIVLLLLALPAVAAWSAHGAIAAIVLGVPSAVILSAAGGTNVRDASAPVMVAVLAVAYLAGIAYALIVPRTRSSPA